MAVDTKLQVLGECKGLDSRDVTQVEEPNVCKHFALPNVSRDDPTEDINLDLHVRGRVNPGELRKHVRNSAQGMFGESLTGM